MESNHAPRVHMSNWSFILVLYIFFFNRGLGWVRMDPPPHSHAGDILSYAWGASLTVKIIDIVSIIQAKKWSRKCHMKCIFIQWKKHISNHKCFSFFSLSLSRAVLLLIHSKIARRVTPPSRPWIEVTLHASMRYMFTSQPHCLLLMAWRLDVAGAGAIATLGA